MTTKNNDGKILFSTRMDSELRKKIKKYAMLNEKSVELYINEIIIREIKKEEEKEKQEILKRMREGGDMLITY